MCGLGLVVCAAFWLEVLVVGFDWFGLVWFWVCCDLMILG